MRARASTARAHLSRALSLSPAGGDAADLPPTRPSSPAQQEAMQLPGAQTPFPATQQLGTKDGFGFTPLTTAAWAGHLQESVRRVAFLLTSTCDL